MTGGEYRRAKNAINNGEAVSRLTIADLIVFKEQVVKHINKCCACGDVEQAMWFRKNQLLELLDLIERAEVLEDEAT